MQGVPDIVICKEEGFCGVWLRRSREATELESGVENEEYRESNDDAKEEGCEY